MPRPWHHPKDRLSMAGREGRTTAPRFVELEVMECLDALCGAFWLKGLLYFVAGHRPEWASSPSIQSGRLP